jgi:hypothetical protein
MSQAGKFREFRIMIACHGRRDALLPVPLAAAKARATHCRRGHEFTPENTYRRPNGERLCRICRRAERKRKPREHPPGPNGRPPHRPTPQLRQIVERMVTILGASHAQCAAVIGLSPTTLAKHYQPELRKAQLAVHSMVAQTYIAKVLGGTGAPGDPRDWKRADTAALIWYTKTQLGWTEAESDNDIGVRMLPLGRDFRDI